MENRIQKALENRKKGYNCSQSVICAYCDLFGVDEKTAFMMSEGFGGGMGQMRETCGAVTAMFMLLGLKNSCGNLEMPASKASTYKLIQESAEKFKNKNSSIVCSELLGLNGQPKLRSCEGCIEDACMIFEEYLALEKKEQEIT